ncbi:hypothetical protein PRIPAC_83319 [Pristionchus pacificus]|uniref:Uncharacterized protein n=1 Tax=Pristionchus pacificus TaxID=54126 RepID=A0A2A6BK44_PRIPA|nr:hypothetical protein PRIPAC_83319 [Pristionchus pacificus]|eukprot:PDM66282.1 hypothetical protein PRIPAC_47699 [Pristionchus pacificus]
MEESETSKLLNGSEEGERIFEIPTLPRGSLLTLRLLTNWGDTSFIGLTAVEIFLESGRRAVVTEVSTSATTHEGELKSVGDLSHFGHSSWRAKLPSPYGDGPVSIDLKVENEGESIAMLRLWNYNESRVHATRGIRDVEMTLDGSLIFKGVISPAFDGDDGDSGETILFTTSDSILESIAENDVCILPEAINSSLSIRPNSAVNRIVPQRPITAEQSNGKEEKKLCEEKREENVTKDDSKGLVKVLNLTLETTWGIREVIGLTGIELFDAANEVIPRSLIESLTVEGGSGDIERLINGRNLTRSKEDIIWNYNASVELSYAGVRNLRIHSNGRTKRRVVLRKAVGYTYFDFVQDVSFDRRIELAHASVDRPVSKCANGFIYQLIILSTWGDEFYVGLNGIELRDNKDQSIRIEPNNLAAFPESVNILPQVQDDPRKSENLTNGINEEFASNSWLTPLLPNRCPRIFFVFDLPTFITKMVIYNYRKTPERGVRHLSISVDDDIVWSGEIPRGSMTENGIIEITLREGTEGN